MDKSSNEANSDIKWFFEKLSKQKRLFAVLESWLGTPYRHRCGVKGKGTDCIFFAGRVMQEVGAIGEFKIPDYARDWHMHKGAREYLLEGIRAMPELIEVGFDSPINGDVILFRYGRASAHASIYFDGWVYQCMQTKVEKRLVDDINQRKKMTHGFRVKT